jgi:hypothetical protein
VPCGTATGVTVIVGHGAGGSARLIVYDLLL